eukprot:m.21657 g.21657  ORF g.21657 m.21657 type:complete len:101 (+) comp8311_c0_seq1:101-403(+)
MTVHDTRGCICYFTGVHLLMTDRSTPVSTLATYTTTRIISINPSRVTIQGRLSALLFSVNVGCVLRFRSFCQLNDSHSSSIAKPTETIQAHSFEEAKLPP